MTEDLPDILRSLARSNPGDNIILNEAAAELERYREAFRAILKTRNYWAARHIAANALKEKS